MDKRIKKTRKTIFEVFLQLLEQKAPGEITAQEIADLAEISRSTFYQHYTDVYNLLDQAEDEIFAEITRLLEGYTYEAIKADPLRLFTELFFYFRRNSKICLVLINKNGSITTGQRISKMIREKFQHEWEALLDCENELAAHYLTQYITAGFVGILQEWIAGGMKEPEEDMAYLARVFITGNTANNSRTNPKEDIAMADYKEKIRNDARGFAGGVLNDTSGLINEKSAEIQKKIEAGLGMASSRLAQTGTDLQTGRGTEADQARRRQKLLKKRAELDEKYGEKIAELTREGKSDKLAETQEKYREEVAKIEAKLTELDAVS